MSYSLTFSIPMLVLITCMHAWSFLVYSESDNHNYCHHEILLSAFPLALEWLDFDPEQPDKKGECSVNLEWNLRMSEVLCGYKCPATTYIVAQLLS